MEPFVLQFAVTEPTLKTACELLSERSQLSKSRIKLAMRCGAAWFVRPPKRQQRLRRATMTLRPGDKLALYYDAAILDAAPPQAVCLKDCHQYSIWFKPAGLMTQGTRYGDHCALARQVEMHFEHRRPVHIVHRLDREVPGLLLVAHGRQPAALLSDLLRSHAISKRYRVRVLGNLAHYANSASIDMTIDGKAAKTSFTLIHYDVDTDQSTANVEIETGRRHQIRRHFDAIGFPVMGDPRYGSGNKNRCGLQLVAYGLSFKCPLGHGEIDTEIDPDKVDTMFSAV